MWKPANVGKKGFEALKVKSRFNLMFKEVFGMQLGKVIYFLMK